MCVTDTDVLIVGAGPVRLFLANECALQPTLEAEVHWGINGEMFDPERPIVEVHLGDSEVWRLANHSFRERHKVVHPIHIHLVTFKSSNATEDRHFPTKSDEKTR